MPAAFLDGLKPTSVVPGFPDWSNAPTRRAQRLSLILIVSQQPKPERPMRPPYSTLTPTRIYDYAAALLEFHLQWQDQGPKCTVKVLLQVLFYAAGHLCSVFAACNQLRDAPSDQAMRDALAALCPDPVPLEQRVNRLFAAQLPKGLRKRSQRVAIDLTLVPYHGQPYQQPTEIYRGQAKGGTTHFHAYATAYIVRRGQRFTVALLRVEHGTPMVEVLKRLLHLARQAGIHPHLLLLDRGFGSRAVIRYLYEARIKTTTPDPALRLLFVAIALILHNAWAWVHYQLLAIPCRGGRKLNLGLLPFKTLLLWLAYMAMQTFGVVDSVAMAQPP